MNEDRVLWKRDESRKMKADVLGDGDEGRGIRGGIVGE